MEEIKKLTIPLPTLQYGPFTRTTTSKKWYSQGIRRNEHRAHTRPDIDRARSIERRPFPVGTKGKEIQASLRWRPVSPFCVLDSSRDVFSRSVSDSVCNVMGTYSTCDCALFYPTGGWRKKYSRIFKEGLLKRIKLHTPRLQISKPLTLLTMTDPTPSCHHCYSEGYHVGPSEGHQPCSRQVLSRSLERDINHLVTFYTNV